MHFLVFVDSKIQCVIISLSTVYSTYGIDKLTVILEHIDFSTSLAGLAQQSRMPAADIPLADPQYHDLLL